MIRWVLESGINVSDAKSIEFMTKDAYNVLNAFEFMGCIVDEMGSL